MKLPYALFDKTLPYFCGGVLFYAFHKRWGAPVPLVSAAMVLLLGTALFGNHDVALAIAGPVVVAWLGARPSVLSRLTDRIGDVSYGVYLFGWPVGLLVTSMAGSTSPLVVFTLSIPIVFALAYAMHRLVEVPVSHHRQAVRASLVAALRKRCSRPAKRRRAAQCIAYVFCLTMILRFVLYPYPFSSNWFGSQWLQLAGICLVVTVILKLGESVSRRPGRRDSPSISG